MRKEECETEQLVVRYTIAEDLSGIVDDELVNPVFGMRFLGSGLD